MSIVKLPVTNGPDTLVDDDIAEKLAGKKLFLGSSGRYVCLSVASKSVTLHRFIMGQPERMQVDHMYGNRFDNTRANLRVCSHSANLLNIRREPKSSSGYRLVYKRSDRPSYSFRIHKDNKPIVFCDFRSRHIGAVFADQILIEFVGPFVKRNFPEEIARSGLCDFLEKTSGRIFRVVFSRRSDGRQREMVCRTGVNSRHAGGTIPFDLISMNLFSVYDVHKQAYRFIPLENVICIRFAKTNYRIVA